jgi:hypothetical protein
MSPAQRVTVKEVVALPVLPALSRAETSRLCEPKAYGPVKPTSTEPESQPQVTPAVDPSTQHTCDPERQPLSASVQLHANETVAVAA